MNRLPRCATSNLNRRRLLGLTLLATIPAAAYGGDPATDGAPTTVERFYDGLFAGMKEGRKVAFRTRFEMVAPAVDQAFDLRAVLVISVGPRWAGFGPDQQAQLLEAFRRYTVASYVSGFESFSGQTFIVSPEPRAVAGQTVVHTRILPASGDASELDYVMRQTPAGWKIVDVLTNGVISRVAVQRSDFRGILMSGGGDALLTSLLRKTSDLSGGQLS